MKQATSIFQLFWQQNPALLYGLTFLLGSLFCLQSPWAALPLLFFLHPKFVFQVVLVFLLPIALVCHFYFFPPTGTEIEGIFHVYSIKKSERFTKGWVYTGVLKTEQGKLECSCFTKTAYNGEALYKIKGRVKALKNKRYKLKPTSEWVFVKKKANLVQIRLTAKQKVKGMIQRWMLHPRSAHFLTAMTTGELGDLGMQKEFRSLGLSHILVISGLHFGLLALFLHFVFRLFLPPKFEACCLMLLFTLYFLFVGDSPSVFRAWIFATLYIFGTLLEKQPTALNTLGVAMLFSLLQNPLNILCLSFQLSFLATAGILLFFEPCQRLLSLWIPQKDLKTVLSKNFVWQISYIVLSLLKKSCALTLAVHIAVLPLLLQTFHVFCLNSLIYNLFFPFLASLALVFFLLGLMLGPWVHFFNSYYCQAILHITENPPLLFKSVYVETLSNTVLGCYLIFILLGAGMLEIKKRGDRLGIANDSLFDHR